MMPSSTQGTKSTNRTMQETGDIRECDRAKFRNLKKGWDQSAFLNGTNGTSFSLCPAFRCARIDVSDERRFRSLDTGTKNYWLKNKVFY